MRPGQQNKQRMRGRGRKGPNPMSRSYESNGPDVKIRGNAQHIAEKYIALARDATGSGDRVMAENYLQHAEHYGRIVAAAQGTFQLQREEPDFEGDYEEDGDENVQENGAPNGHPYPVPERAGGERPPQSQPNQMQRERDHSGRDYNREGQGRDQNRDYQNNREQRFNRDNRDGQGRDGQGRDGQPRDGQSRDGQGRDNQGREFQGRDRNRDFNRDRNRDFNRDNQRQNGDEQRRPWENRGERQPNWQDRNERQQTPGGLGPQPIIDEIAADETHVENLPAVPVPQTDRRPEERNESVVAASEPVTAQESGFGQAPAATEVLAEPEGSILPTEDAPAEPRRRTRQRRPRLHEGEVVAPVAAEPAAEEAAAAPVAQAVAAEDLPAAAEAGEAPAAKRARGRPRKKKTDEANGDGETSHVPDFLLASNG